MRPGLPVFVEADFDYEALLEWEENPTLPEDVERLRELARRYPNAVATSIAVRRPRDFAR